MQPSLTCTQSLIDPEALDQQVRAAAHSLPPFRSALEQARCRLAEQFEAGVAAPVLVHAYAECVDQLLSRVWRQFELDDGDSALIAVGGYGRAELHPGSDVDLMVLRTSDLKDSLAERIAAFVTQLFDIGLEVGYSVRTVAQCEEEARREITVATSLMEARLLAGPAVLFEAMLEVTGPQNMWPSKEFFEAKLAEQRERHHRYNDTVHNLEPNIKHGPGGLRDIQMIGWVAKRHFGASTLHELVDHGFLTQPEYELLIEGQTLLWRIRLSLHLLAGRGEERLLFDHQRALAAQFGYRDDEHRLAVEHFMKPYYRMSTELSRLNEMLLSLFQEAIVLARGADDQITPVNERFAIRNGFLEVVHDQVFLDSPLALFELFLIAQTNSQVRGVRAATIRLVRAHRHLIDDAFRADAKACELFVAIMSQPRGITHELRRMHRYGLLGLYLPSFGAIEGQMQHDLFHAYTVDEHSLFVVGNLRGFAVPERAHEFPLCSEIIRRLQKPELVYLAGLFHDIAKGRGGDHSQLGSQDASEFCLHHGFGPYDARIVSWLVEHHLLMSVTAQRKDISDPQVINEFAATVGDLLHLDSLYLLTVADIRATNPNLWNDWKDTLLKDLYETTQYALGRGLENPVGKSELIAETLSEARRLLGATNVVKVEFEQLWEDLTENYFLRADPEEIAWHTQVILHTEPGDLPLIALHAGHGGTDLFVYTHDQHALFATIASTLDRLGLSILDARIITTERGMTLDSFVVVEAGGVTIQSSHRELEIRTELSEQLRAPAEALRVTRRRRYRRLRHFPIPTQVKFDVDHANQRTVMEVITSDRPGLLSKIGWALVDTSVNLQNAKIATFGERAEDMFYITDAQQRTLSTDRCEALRTRVIAALEETDPG